MRGISEALSTVVPIPLLYSGRKHGGLRGRVALASALLVSAAFAAGAAAQTYEQLHGFARTHLVGPAALLRAGDGNFYGTTEAGGTYGYGTVFRLDPDGWTLTTLHSFDGSDGENPSAALIEDDGYFYGTTAHGGASGYGTVFRIAKDTWVLTTLHSFTGSDGKYPYAALIEFTESEGTYLYGTTSYGGPSDAGTVFRIAKSEPWALTTLHSFTGSDGEGARPYQELTDGLDGYFYGTTTSGGSSGRGTVFRIEQTATEPDTWALTTLHSFDGTDGEDPSAALLDGNDGYLYGTTYSGGGSGSGTVFRIAKSDPWTLTTMHEFDWEDGMSPDATLIEAGGSFYGTTSFGGENGWGTVFRINETEPGSGIWGLTTLHSFDTADGAQPAAALIDGGEGTFYGTTESGGAYNMGTVFSIVSSDPWTFTSEYAFVYSGGGAEPSAAVIKCIDGSFYGTTRYGGDYGYGTVFRLDPNDDWKLTALHSFGGSDGAYPMAALVEVGGYLYGTTLTGGESDYGTVFRIDKDTSKLTVLRSFADPDGISPSTPLIDGSDGYLYGTTEGGGASYAGTVFRIAPGTGELATLHSFSWSDGASPQAALIKGSDGWFYGTTRSGTADGTVFRIKETEPGTWTLETLHEFKGSFGGEGGGPQGALIDAGGGSFYGTTYAGGDAEGHGTVFRIDPPGTEADPWQVTFLHLFDGSDGAHPPEGLIEGTDGLLYGVTESGGTNDDGTVFRVEPGTGAVTTVHAFDGSDGSFPQGALLEGVDGYLFGTTAEGGTYGGGTVFRIGLATPESSLEISDASVVRRGGTITVRVQITNTNDDDAMDVTVTAATLGGVDTNSQLPLVFGKIKAGKSKQCTLQFKNVPSGDETPLTVTGTSSLGDFFRTQTVTVP